MIVSGIQKYIIAFSLIQTDIDHKRWTSVTHWSTHDKPFLLLSVLDLISQKNIQTNMIEITEELEKKFSRYWICVMPEYKSNIASPFYHLKDDKFWHLIPQQGKEFMVEHTGNINSLYKLNNLVKGAKFDDALFQLLIENKTRNILRNVIVQSYFSADIQALVLRESADNSRKLPYNHKPVEHEKKQIKDLSSQIFCTKSSKIDDGKPITKQFDNLVYFSNDNWISFPQWAYYYMELGASLSNFKSEGTKFILAITTPVRNFAASLIAAGLIISTVDLPSSYINEYISKIENLPIGTPVTFRQDNRQKYGFYYGRVERGGQSYFNIQHLKRGEIYIPIENASTIEVSEKIKKNLPNNSSGRQLAPPSPLLTHLFEKETISKFVVESKLECVILGQQNIFRKELCEFQIGFKSNKNQIAYGKFVDLIRPRGSQFQPPNFSYRSYILPSNNTYNAKSIAKLGNNTTIFDNHLGFIKWHDSFKKSNWIVILDKTANNFDLAIKEVNEAYLLNQVDKRLKISLPSPPAGIDLMFFEVRP
jgi:hypothetical protein